MRRIALIFAIWPVFAGAQEWPVLRGDSVRAALEGHKLVYVTGAWQEFRASGRTLYNAGSDSWGYWRVQGDQYCSMWPPSDLWACYDLSVSGDTVRFIDASGEISEGRYVD